MCSNSADVTITGCMCLVQPVASNSDAELNPGPLQILAGMDKVHNESKRR